MFHGRSATAAARPLAMGVALWLAGTIVVRLAGEQLLRPTNIAASVALYAISFAAMALMVPPLVGSGATSGNRWRALAMVMLPTLLLDPLSCLFFAALFPNVTNGAAGVFGGWMLICCAGAVVGSVIHEGARR